MDQLSYYQKGMESLLEVIQDLSHAKSLDEIIEVTRVAARELTGADGATFVLRDQDKCYYVDENAIGPLWKGKRFPLQTCISGWAMLNRKSVAIEDIYQDPRIPMDAYRPTFVKSLLMVPIRKEQPIGAIGNYWANHHTATNEQIKLLEALANSTSIALENIKHYNELKEVNKSLEHSIQVRDEFMSITAHELRTPLSSIKLQLQMVNRKLSDQQVKGNLDISLGQVDRLAKLVEQLLDVSRIQLGKIDLNYTKTNCTELLNQVVTLFKPQIEQAGGKIDSKIDEGIWAECDSMKLEQITINLLSNIVKHAPKSDVHVLLETRKDETLILTIQDHGPGIPLDVQKRLFQRYERGDSPRYVSGFGLGLFITKSLVEAHGGTITLTSELKAGTKIVVEVPLTSNKIS